jgi:pimeloyl-ACP methyl ester carboxylesterase
MQKIILLILSIFLSLSVFARAIFSEEPIILNTDSGDIHGTLRNPATENGTVPIVLIIAGSGPTDRNGNQPQMQNNSLKMLSEALYQNGMASLAFDKRGIGESASSMTAESDLRFEDYINDVREWINLLSNDKRFAEIIVAGHSEGSLIGMIAAQNNPNISKFISISGVGEPAGNILKEQLTAQLAGQPETIKDMIFGYIDKLENGETIDDVPQMLYSLFRPSVQPYMISWFKYNPQTEIEKLNIPVLILQGTTDIQVSVAQAELLSKAQPNARKVIIENMNHVLKDSESTDMMTQFTTTYNNPNSPINKELIETIVEFVKR